MAKGISPQLEEKIKQYQNLQQRISSFQQQIQQLRLDMMDIDRALKEIEDLPDDEVCYRSIGRLMVKSTVKEAKQKLNDQKELSDTRIKMAEKSKEKSQKQFDELETQIKAALEGKGARDESN